MAELKESLSPRIANVEAQLLADDLLSRKQENLKAQKHLVGGATC